MSHCNRRATRGRFLPDRDLGTVGGALDGPTCCTRNSNTSTTEFCPTTDDIVCITKKLTQTYVTILKLVLAMIHRTTVTRSGHVTNGDTAANRKY
jgi:hypothetical protein